jgi:hypothetical protein
MVSPVAGVAIAFLCVVVILGNKNPPVVEAISTWAEASGLGLLIPILPFSLNVITSAKFVPSEAVRIAPTTVVISPGLDAKSIFIFFVLYFLIVSYI